MDGNINKLNTNGGTEPVRIPDLHRKIQILEWVLIFILVLCLGSLILNVINFYSLSK